MWYNTYMNKSSKKPIQAFAQGKARWESTLKRSAQSKGTLGRTSQNKLSPRQKNLLSMYGGKYPLVRDKKKEATIELGRAMRRLHPIKIK